MHSRTPARNPRASDLLAINTIILCRLYIIIIYIIIILCNILICIANLECNAIISFASLAYACHLAINTPPPCTYITRQRHELKDPCSLVISLHITWSHVHNACSCVVSLWQQVTYWTHATPMAHLHVSIPIVSKWPFNYRAAIALPVSPSSTCDIYISGTVNNLHYTYIDLLQAIEI